MFELVIDSSTVVHASAPAWPLRVVTFVAPYLMAGFVGWVGSSVRFGRKLRRVQDQAKAQMQGVEATFTAAMSELTTTLTEKMDTMRSDIDTRLHEGDREMQALAQEVWGAQRANGLRGDIRKLQEQSASQQQLLVRIDTQMGAILDRLKTP